MKQNNDRFTFKNHTGIALGGLLIFYLVVLMWMCTAEGEASFNKNRLIIFSSLCLLAALIFLFLKFKYPKKPLMDGLFRYRFIIAILYFIMLVGFEISGSSISSWGDYYLEDSEVEEHTLFGKPRQIRSDEWGVNTPMLLSQYSNKTGEFPYFSDTIRGTMTDVFIIYGQPVLDIAVIFRPFHWGYLFLSQGQGLSFFWIGRSLALFLVTLELSMLITKKNKLLSVATAILMTFAPAVQWWFAVNGLVEMLVFGQLAILLIYYYMKTERIWKRSLYAVILAICAGGYILTFYPAWQIPLFYIFFAMAIGVIISNYHKGVFSRKDLGSLLIFLLILAVGLGRVLLKSSSTIMATLNTVYPGARLETGGYVRSRFFQYIGNMFFPYKESGMLTNVCEEAVFFDFFPLGILFSVITLFKQKKKDVFLISVLVVNVFLSLWCIVPWPEWLAKITLLSSAPAVRVHAVLGIANIFLLIRSLSLEKIRVKPPMAIAAAALYSAIMVIFSKRAYGEYFELKYMVISFVILLCLSIFLFLQQSKKVQSVFAVLCMGMALAMGGVVNPVEQGVGALMEQPVVKEVQRVSESNEGLWIVEGLIRPVNNITIPAGAPTINSTNVYPFLKRWEMLDEEGQYTDIYNRYAHIMIYLKDSGKTEFVDTWADSVTVHLNVDELHKINASYILTVNDLTAFDNDRIKFNCISAVQGFYIYEILYDVNQNISISSGKGG